MAISNSVITEQVPNGTCSVIIRILPAKNVPDRVHRMYGLFAYAELLSGLADGGFVLDDVHSKVKGPFFYVRVHLKHSHVFAV